MFRQNIFKKIMMKGGEEKMKKLMVLLAVVAIVSLGFISAADALTTTGTIAVKAIIAAGTPDMSFEIHKTNDGDPDFNPWTGYTSATDLTFDKWDIVQRPTKAAQWVSVTKNYLIVFATGMGDDYQILADGAGSLTGPGGTLPATSFMCDPIYSATDEWWIDLDADGVKDPGETYAQGAMPGTLGALGSILGIASKPIYSSESPVGSARIIQILFMFPAYNTDGVIPYTGYVPIPATQAAGTYQGTATVTVRIAAK
jgi:hypothetical protein